MTPRTALVVVVARGGPALLRGCLEHLAGQTRPADRVVVVDSSADEGALAVVAGFAGVELRRDERGGGTATSRAVGVAAAGEDVVAFIDDAALARPDWLERLLAPYDAPEVAAVGGRCETGRPGEGAEGLGEIGLLLPSGRLTAHFAADPGRPVDADHLPGANLSIRLGVVAALGGIRDPYRGRGAGDADIALRARRAGWRVVYEPGAVVRLARDERGPGDAGARGRFVGARDHVVLLRSAAGGRSPVVRRYLRTAAAASAWDLAHAVRAALRGRAGSLRVLPGSAGRAAVDLVGTAAGLIGGVARADRARGIPLPATAAVHPPHEAGAA